jgi:hypothetical protein
MAIHTESKALAALGRKNDIQIHGSDLRVLNNESPFKVHDLGNKSWGRIDFLVNYYGYSQYFVTEF